MEILHKNELNQGGFEGLKEHRIVMDQKGFGEDANPGTWQGIGSFIFLADAQFMPHGETTLHSHKEVDVISVMIKGCVSHEGSLKHGQTLQAGEVQVQRAGGEGFSHNEINPDDRENRMIQLWALPERAGECAGYKLYRLPGKGLIRVYGGNSKQDETFGSDTVIEVGYLKKGEQLNIDQDFLMYFTQGRGVGNGETIMDGDLVRAESLHLDVKEDAMVIVMKQKKSP